MRIAGTEDLTRHLGIVEVETTIARDGLEDFAETLLDRIEAVDHRIFALLPEKGRRTRLRDEARALLSRYPDPESRPPLFGVPVAVKDIFHVEGFETRAGSQAFPALFAGDEAHCVSALRRAGALVAGKTVTTEFAMRAAGPTRNPRAPGHTPGGSSSGSAAAVAAGFATLALGSQTVGSTIRPAAFCGIAGFKPSYERIPSRGILYVSRSLDHVGLLAPDVESLARAAPVVIEDWTPRPPAGERAPVLGVPEGPYLAHASPDGGVAFEAALARLSSAGYEIRRLPLFPDFDEVYRLHRRLSVAEMAREHADLFPAYGALYRDPTVRLLEEGRDISDAEIAEARSRQARLRDEIEGAMTEGGVDLWASPAATGAAPEGLDFTGDPVMNASWTFAGLPALTVPTAFLSVPLPYGLQLAGRFGADETLLAWGAGIESSLAG